ncbi:MAG: RimK family alpha-L-glutamate ligase [Lachnospiraceae bacterium]|nr:RimK family alpha-L-glutamate ligase [Lachnospiraceae bacterium]
MNGWLITNEFVTSEKFKELFSMFYKAAVHLGIKLTQKSNSEVWTMLGSCGYRLQEFFTVGCPFRKNGMELVVSAEDVGLDIPDFILFWDKDIRLAHELERQGMRLFNCARAIEDCDDKAVTYLKLRGAGIPQPPTYISPKKFHPDGLFDKKALDTAAGHLGFPCIVKECYGSFGEQVYLAPDMNTLQRFVMDLGDRPYLIQQYVSESRGRDIRVEVVGGRVVAAMLRSNPRDYRSNLTSGGTAQPYTVSIQQAQLAIAACQALGLDFAGVDILFGPGDMPVLCEVNSNAHFKNLYDCTGVNAAEEIMQYIHGVMSRYSV